MYPRKPESEKIKNAGVSLEPKLIKEGKKYAQANGFGTISNLVRFLVVRELKTEEIASWVGSKSERRRPSNIPKESKAPRQGPIAQNQEHRAEKHALE